MQIRKLYVILMLVFLRFEYEYEYYPGALINVDVTDYYLPNFSTYLNCSGVLVLVQPDGPVAPCLSLTQSLQRVLCSWPAYLA